MHSPPAIRPFQSSDLEALKAMTVDAFQGVSIDEGLEREFGEIGNHDWRWRKARHVDDDVQRDPGGIFVLETDGLVAGYISTWCDRGAGIGYIPNLVVIPRLRGQGWGRRLIEAALDHFRAQGLTHARIETLMQNAVGRHLYTSVGFREIAQQIHFGIDLKR